MELWYSIVIGTVIFMYIQSYNRIAKMYLENDKNLTFQDFFSKIIPLDRLTQ